MILQLHDGYYISEFADSDRDTIVANLQDRSVYEWTLQIPHPYTAVHADEWLATLRQKKEADGQVTNWAIRNAQGTQIGGIGFHPAPAGQTHAAELGYWITKAFWGRGIMTAAVNAISLHAFAQPGIVRITAGIFAGNAGSARVLEKCGFHIEAPLMRRCYRKDGQFIDAVLYARVCDAEPATS